MGERKIVDKSRVSMNKTDGRTDGTDREDEEAFQKEEIQKTKSAIFIHSPMDGRMGLSSQSFL